MNDAGARKFRSQLGGYHKEDVNRYIKETDLRHAEETEALRQEAESLRAEVESIRAGQESAERKAEELRSAAAEFDAIRAGKDAEIEALRAELEALNRNAESLAATVSALREENTALKSEAEAADGRMKEKEAEAEQAKSDAARQIEQIRTTVEKQVLTLRRAMDDEVSKRVAQSKGSVDDKNSDAYKLNMYDKISSQLGDILINANRNADEILSNAKAEAERIRNDTALECEQKRADCDAVVARTKQEPEEEAAYIRERLSQTASELLSSVSGDLHGSVDNCIRELSTCIQDMEYEIQTLLAKIGNRTEEMNGLIAYYQGCVTDGVAAKLRSMDEKYGIVPAEGAGGDHA